MAENEFSLTIDLHQGTSHDRIIACDLTHEYVTINASYRT
jgi:N-acetylglutamate synthase/N-acetylornithine aminotransferase